MSLIFKMSFLLWKKRKKRGSQKLGSDGFLCLVDDVIFNIPTLSLSFSLSLIQTDSFTRIQKGSRLNGLPANLLLHPLGLKLFLDNQAEWKIGSKFFFFFFFFILKFNTVRLNFNFRFTFHGSFK